ncbi:NADH-quinone oxidoreductase subunit L [Shewanella sp. AS16]|uniref:NADH-quinone oxidoreductase subunit L n=1 Tax=Shewanella sp. AS16 TaxID=2907625 RepID=UPI001F2C87CC|nr:NADH-quinone oxidoreductase subunit L [Shewanella sp. AS16]MCE9687728.1 NADH-quinone oxidoreductase subunit L [Shewanella sp. AS16]
MDTMLLAIPLLPLLSSLALILLQPGKRATPILGVGSVMLSAILVAGLQLLLWQQTRFVETASFGTWLNTDRLEIGLGLYLDALSLVMISVITGVGALIHLFSASYMRDDPDYSRFFAYLNLFVAAMLILVLADNLLLLYLGWEGVGLCSYLLIGFWYKVPANNAAANKAFLMTRIGDTALMLGLFLLFYRFNSLNIAEIQTAATELLGAGATGEPLLGLSCLLLFAGAVGKSAQLPLQSWLPDAMAGPTPVSALIHAATMVTAGVYLVARNYPLFELAPAVLLLIATIGCLTLLLGAGSALVQTDLKRVLAYSTMSQLGYMFLALGIGAPATAIFHLMTHAFFKALLFLAAGSLIYSLQHQQNILKMGGLWNKQPLLLAAFGVGCAALASLPMTSGFFSKEMILEKTAESGHPLLWLAAVTGAFITALYSARLFYLIFFGRQQTQLSHDLPGSMTWVLLILTALALLGGIEPQGLSMLQGSISAPEAQLGPLQHWLPLLLPLLGIGLAWWLFSTGVFTRPSGPRLTPWVLFLRGGWGMDTLYLRLFVAPFVRLSHLNRHDVIDRGYGLLAGATCALHRLTSRLQTGQLRGYAASIILFCLVGIAWGILG